MTKRVIGVLFVGLSLSIFVAAQRCHAQDFARDSLALNNAALFRPSSAPALWSRALLSNPLTFDWMMPAEALPSSNVVATNNFSAPVSSRTSLPERLLETVPKFTYATGEVGFLYGRSTGKFGGESKQAYIIGETGNDKTQIFVGASYEDSSLRFPRSGR